MHRCSTTALSGLLVGCAGVAYAQDVPANLVTESALPWVEIIKSLGLPGVLGYIGYQLGKGLPEIRVTVSLNNEEKQLLKDIAERVRAD